MTMSLRDYLWRNRSTLTKQELAKRLGINRTYLSKVVNGLKTPSIELSKKIELETKGEVIWQELMEFCHVLEEAHKQSKSSKV